MPTQKEYRRAMLQANPELLGTLETPSAEAAQTLTFPRLATGGYTSQKYVGTYMLRPDIAVAADRVRVVSSVAPATGVFTHAGTAYATALAGSEQAELLKYDPILYDTAIQETLRKLRREDRATLPTVAGEDRYYLSGQTWVTGPMDIQRIALSRDPTIGRNRGFDKWTDYNTTLGTLIPDDWTFAGTNATIARSTTAYRGQYSALVTTTGGGSGTLTQTLGLLDNGTAAASDESLRGNSVTFVARVRTATAAHVTLRLNDGLTTTTGTAHTGGGGWEELSVTKTIAAGATSLSASFNFAVASATAFVDDAYIFEGTATNDTLRRGRFDETELEPSQYDYDQFTNSLVLPWQGRGAQYVVYTRRPYTAFASSRVYGGTADGDSSDAPLIHVMAGACAHMFQALADRQDEDTRRFQQLADTWRQKFETLAMGLLHVETQQGQGVSFNLGMLAPPVGR